MNVHIDENAAHATYAPSSAHRWAEEGGCSASAEAIAHLGEQEEGDEAAEGTAAHDEIERILGAFNGQVVQPEQIRAAADALSDNDHPAAYGIALVLDYAAKLPAGRLWVEQRVRLTGQIWGRCDLAHWHEQSATLTIIDYKNGFVGVDLPASQLRIYGAESIYTHNLPAKWIRYAVVQPRDFRPVPRVKQDVESASDLFKFAERVAAIPAGPKRFVAGEQCTYCPLFGRCEASRDLLKNVGALIAGLMTPDQVPAEQRALFAACAKPIADAFKGADKAWTKAALAGAVPPGMKLVTSQPHRAWLDAAAARREVINALGEDALELPSPAQAEKLGMAKAEVATLAAPPPGGPVLAPLSDARKPWAPKTAAEMFKGVAASLSK